MDEKQETFTRAEVEALLQELQDQNIQMIKDHFQAERDKKLPPLWVPGIMVCILFGTLWAITVWG
jgi:hypothetical protein